MGRIDDRQMRYLMGAIVIVMLGVHAYREYILDKDAPIPTSWWFAAIAGFLAGATTMIANAAGPVTMVYLLSMRLPREQFIGTSAWYFFILRWLKVPFSVNLGLIAVQILTLASAIKMFF